MSWDLVTAYTRTGLTVNPANDAILTGEMAATISIVEAYLQRRVLFVHVTEEITLDDSNRHIVAAYPIDQVFTPLYHYNDGATKNIPKKQINHRRGIVHVDVKPGPKNIEYWGGYKPADVPLDLEMALWFTFESVRSINAGAAPAAGNIKKISIAGVGALDYNTAGTPTSTAAAGFGGTIPATAVGILDLYRRIVC